MKRKLFLLNLLFCLVFFSSYTRVLHAQDCGNNSGCWQDKIDEYQSKINELQGQAQTLASTISYLNSKIKLTETEIAKTEIDIEVLKDEVNELSFRIYGLNVSLNQTAQRLKQRIISSYKRYQIKPFYYLLSSKLSPAHLKYMYVAEQQDKQLLLEMEQARINYDAQKDLKETKQAEQEALIKKLAGQKATLAQQQSSKQGLLATTKNDEQQFQQLLAKARAEYSAIQAIMAGQGTEIEVGGIGEGEQIASIISGISPCSRGTHLHFEVAVNNTRSNPANYLQSKDVDWDLCGWWPDCDSTFSFTGSWNWPINGKPRITQGYGMTGYAKTGAYRGGPHTGLDMVSDDLQVKSVKPGVLYRGSISCGGGTLRYVKVDHGDSDIDTYYLHINYL
ncbi:hypothetical protein KKD62_00750 [Patescibacteria group bacterium]|nr:hypothetical protein [Patescibacteria group bacterium]MBU1931463.1 hypothetical protein [Patescibacteria group bacterium]